MSPTDLAITQHGYVRHIKLNRPDRMNALGRTLIRELHNALEDCRFDRETRVILLSGAGQRAFCAGADLKERAEMAQDEVDAFVSELRTTFHLLFNHPKITVAALNGAALGGGLELALSCDLRYAHNDVRLGLTETRLAIIPGAGGTQLLPRVIGPAKAKEMIFRAQPINAAEAQTLGLVNDVFPAEELITRCLEIGTQISQNGPIALMQAKKAVNQGLQCSLDQGLHIEQLCYAGVIPTEDRLEGLAAFKEKRKPAYQGR
ncbi:enoyl-CoA hydratase-related protein [Acanthopleuribacter pedis]|uniref:Enoyl-CoA hydratase/isomerase family protein n=1 Tax=Acanthopleuribacter pedis TaxID=442870 RepID=A0A8J7U5B4_9BACT|nr:enoyl-CoA hydratase-related protein [Acanthopleuribacter pedis]MBO1319146.1 enoyl-CoA hydratase/isomerase family protein [Acanthopleuribacter pedis]